MHPDVRAALDRGGPVVALESTIISHGMPFPQNVEMATEVEQLVRAEGAVPATIAVLDGRPHVGLDAAQLQRLASSEGVLKATTRDLPWLMATGRNGRDDGRGHDAPRPPRRDPRVRHRRDRRGAPRRGDVVRRLGRPHRAGHDAGGRGLRRDQVDPRHRPDVGAAGDAPGCPVIVNGSDEFPSFYSRTSGLPAPRRLDGPDEIAAVLHAAWDVLGLTTGVSIANPIPPEAEIPADEITGVIDEALAALDEAGDHRPGGHPVPARPGGRAHRRSQPGRRTSRSSGTTPRRRRGSRSRTPRAGRDAPPSLGRCGRRPGRAARPRGMRLRRRLVDDHRARLDAPDPQLDDTGNPGGHRDPHAQHAAHVRRVGFDHAAVVAGIGTCAGTCAGRRTDGRRPPRPRPPRGARPHRRGGRVPRLDAVRLRRERQRRRRHGRPERDAHEGRRAGDPARRHRRPADRDHRRGRRHDVRRAERSWTTRTGSPPTGCCATDPRPTTCTGACAPARSHRPPATPPTTSPSPASATSSSATRRCR